MKQRKISEKKERRKQSSKLKKETFVRKKKCRNGRKSKW